MSVRQAIKIFFKAISFFIFFFSCVKDKPNPDHNILPNATHTGVLISCEGSYGNNNGELSFLDFETGTMFSQLFRIANQTQAGDVLQSVTLMNGNYYIAINASDKIIVVHANTYQLLATISGIHSPRYITQVSAQKAYVSSLYFPFVYVLNLQTNTVGKTILVDHPNTEKMIAKNEYCYVTNWDTSSGFVYKIHTLTDSIEQAILFPARASHDIVTDRNGMLWILFGNKYKNKSSWLFQYDPVNVQIIKSISFTADADPFRLVMNASGDTLFFINVNYNGGAANNGLYKMGILENDIPLHPFIQANTNSYFWALGIDSLTQHIFLSDPKGFTQQSTVYEYAVNGDLLQQYSCGIGANGFLFKY